MSLKDNKTYKYWNKIRQQCNEFYYFDSSLNFKERQYFFHLKMDAVREINKLIDYE